MRGLLKLAVVVVIVWAIWKVGVPWWEARNRGSAADKTENGSTCPASAERASNMWGSGIGRFVNPPYDLAAWGEFRGRVEDSIRQAEKDCACAQPSCESVRGALTDLRGLIADLDVSIRNGTPPPSDVVQRQEHIDNRIEEARRGAGS
jgi:hypothetical protein